MLVLLAGIMLGGAAAAQTTEPAWLVIERADRLAADGAFGRAMQLYRRALDLDPGNPEAHFGLGRAFKAVGDYPVAEDHLQIALGAAERFAVPDSIFEIHYELAELYRVQRRFAEYETTLAGIIELTETDADPVVLRGVLDAQGLDRLLVLYRLPEDGATRARGDLAELLVGLGRYPAAAQLALVAAVQQLSTVIDAVLRRDPEYTFASIAGAEAAGQSYRETREYLSQTLLHRDLYYLAAALYAEGNSQLARVIWRILADLPQAGEMGVRARIQLADPRVEPLIIPPLP